MIQHLVWRGGIGDRFEMRPSKDHQSLVHDPTSCMEGRDRRYRFEMRPSKDHQSLVHDPTSCMEGRIGDTDLK
jgi:hypothetical protein